MGRSHDEFVVVCHQKGPESIMNSSRGTVEFTGVVDGRAGDMMMKFGGKLDSTICNPSGVIWYGTRVIIGDTGVLADLHGNGEWSGPSLYRATAVVSLAAAMTRPPTRPHVNA